MRLRRPSGTCANGLSTFSSNDSRGLTGRHREFTIVVSPESALRLIADNSGAEYCLGGAQEEAFDEGAHCSAPLS